MPGTGSYTALWGPNVVTTDASGMEGALVWGAGTQASAVALSNGTTDPACDGTHSLKVTKGSSSSGALCVNNSQEIPVAINTSYVFTFGFWTSKASVTFNIAWEWYTSGQVFISSTTTPTVTAIQASDNSGWTIYPAQVMTSPSTAAWARLNVQMVAGLTTGDVVYMDSFYLARQLLPPDQAYVFQPMNRAANR